LSPFWIISILTLIQVLFGINFSTSKIIVLKLDPIVWSNIRFLVAGIILLIITLVSKRKHPKVDKYFIKNVIILSLLGMALGQGLFLFGLRYTTSVNTSIITTTIPLLTLFTVVIRKQEELTWPKLIGIILGFMGVVFIRDLTKVSFSSDSFQGDILVFLGAFCFALYLSLGKDFLRKYDNLWITTYMFLISGLFMFFINVPKFINFRMPELDVLFVGSVVFTILGATLLTYYLNNLVLRYASPAQVALFIYLQPIIAGLFGWYFLEEEINLRTIICFLLILSGVLVSLMEKRLLKKSN
jgi:drug/metabolite transporter (DMT)-like permease